MQNIGISISIHTFLSSSSCWSFCIILKGETIEAAALKIRHARQPWLLLSKISFSLSAWWNDLMIKCSLCFALYSKYFVMICEKYFRKKNYRPVETSVAHSMRVAKRAREKQFHLNWSQSLKQLNSKHNFIDGVIQVTKLIRSLANYRIIKLKSSSIDNLRVQVTQLRISSANKWL